MYKPLVNGKPKFQPTITLVCTIGHQVAKYLLPISEPLEINEYVTKDLFIFAKKTKGIKADGFFGKYGFRIVIH